MNPTKLPNPKTKSIDFNWPIVIFLLIMTGIPAIPGLFILLSVLSGPGAVGDVSSMVNPLYFNKPLAISVHAGSGLLFFLSVPFQFSIALRSKYPRVHKKGGYIALVSGCVMALSGVWMHHFLNGGVMDVRYISLGIQSFCLCAAFFLAVKHILNRNIRCHRRWVSRAVAIALSLVTLAFIELILVIVLGEQARNNVNLIQFFHTYGNLIGMTVNMLVLEYFLNKKPQEGKAFNN